MANKPQQPATEKRVPMGVALIVLGGIILGFGAVGWQTLRSSGRLAEVPGLPGLLARATVAAGGLGRVPGDGSQPILLPETPLDAAQYPSVASVEDAGRAPPPPVAGQPQRITIPALGVDAPVTAVGLDAVVIDGETFLQWAVPRSYEAGWHQDSALLGEMGNTVINGHNNTLGEIFRDLVDLQPGDTVLVYDGDGPHSYVVADVLQLPEQGQPTAVRVANANWIAPTDDERLTLVSCWPYATNSHRLIVVAFPVR